MLEFGVNFGGMKSLRYLAFVTAVWLTSSPALACVRMFQELTVQRDFAVEVRGWDGKSMPRVQVRLVPEQRDQDGDQVVVAADENGIAEFRNVDLGDYRLETAQANGEIAYIKVVAVPAPLQVQQVQQNVVLRWPDIKVVSAQRASGQLDFPAWDRLGLTILDAISGEKLESAVAEKNGNFEFSELRPGLYFIRILSLTNVPVEIGDIAVDINPKAEKANLELSLLQTTCGLSYSELNVCAPLTAVVVNNVCGTVVDEMGAVIPAARISLKSSEGKASKLAKSGKTGSYYIKDLAPGEYILHVSSLGFQPLRMPLRVLDGNGDLCAEPLVITLGVPGGICGNAQVGSGSESSERP